MKHIKVFKITGLVLGLLPVVALAQAGGGFLDGWTRLVRFIISSLFPILISIAGVLFMVQVIRFIMTGDTTKRDQLRTSVLWNLGILFVLLTFFGLIQIVTGIFDLQIGTDIATVNSVGNTCTRDTIRGIIMCILKFVSNTMIPTVFAVAVLVFMWNMSIYLTRTDNETERTKARNYVFWSLLAIAIMLTMFSIINVGTQTLFGSGSFIPQFPTSK